MNPEEGDLRPQLLDRFALSVEVSGISNASERMDILERHIEFEGNADAFQSQWQPEEDALTAKIAAAREIIDEVGYTRGDLRTIALMTSSMRIDGHRADLVILKAARAHAAFEGRRQINRHDILLAFELAIPHRLKRGPFADAMVDMAALSDQMAQIEAEAGQGDDETQPAQVSQNQQSDGKKKPNR
jgi:Mg-chelatase subunit ChlI